MRLSYGAFLLLAVMRVSIFADAVAEKLRGTDGSFGLKLEPEVCQSLAETNTRLEDELRTLKEEIRAMQEEDEGRGVEHGRGLQMSYQYDAPTGDSSRGTMKTTGACEVTAEAQSNTYEHEWCNAYAGGAAGGAPLYPSCYPNGVPPWHAQDNIVVTLPNPANCDVAVSDTWTITGWDHTFVQLAPGAVFSPPPLDDDMHHLVKVMSGTVLDVDYNGLLRNDGRWETYPVTTPNRARPLHVSSSVASIEAGDDGAVFTYFTVPREVMNARITSMDGSDGSPIQSFAGPHSELLEWLPFSEKNRIAGRLGDWSNNNGVEFHNLNGILMNTHNGERFAYMQWWTIREDMEIDGGYHNHADKLANNTFGELHLMFAAADANSGMQARLPGTQNLDVYPNPSPQPTSVGSPPGELNHRRWVDNDTPDVQLAIPQPAGFIHGPLWSIQSSTGRPTIDCLGRIVYPGHRMLAGGPTQTGAKSFHDPPRYTLWMAFELLPEDVVVPNEMLQYWYNADLQSELANFPDGQCRSAPW